MTKDCVDTGGREPKQGCNLGPWTWGVEKDRRTYHGNRRKLGFKCLRVLMDRPWLPGRLRTNLLRTTKRGVEDVPTKLHEVIVSIVCSHVRCQHSHSSEVDWLPLPRARLHALPSFLSDHRRLRLLHLSVQVLREVGGQDNACPGAMSHMGLDRPDAGGHGQLRKLLHDQ